MLNQHDTASAFEASFGFESVFTQLFRHVDPVQELRSDRSDSDHWDEFFLERAAGASRRGNETYIPMFLQDEVTSAASAPLFHERVHYWQLLSASAIQRQMLNYLAHLQVALEAAGGHPFLIWTGGAQRPPAVVLRNAVIWHQNFDTRGLKTFDKIERYDFSNEPLTFIGKVSFGVSPDTAMEGYYAFMAFSSNSETMLALPLVGRVLLESATHISELLLKGEPLPHAAHLTTEEDAEYGGAWELWCRVSGPRYKKDIDLALSFLAVVDLATNPELPATHHFAYSTVQAVNLLLDLPGGSRPDFPDWAGISSVPARFGRALLATLNLSPFSLEGRTPADAVIGFQEQICRLLGWQTPTRVAIQMAAYFTHILAPVLAQIADVDALKTFLERKIVDLELHDLKPIWAILNRPDVPDLVGISVLKAMVNASVFRASNPGKIAAPHEYSNELTESFPLPIILHEGKYYHDERLARSRPLEINPLNYWSECVKLMTIGHLRYSEDKTACGFVRRDLVCQYMAAGGGCPKRGLSCTEEARRKAVGLELDWCHWQGNAEYLGLIPQDKDRRVSSVYEEAWPVFFTNEGMSKESYKKLLCVWAETWLGMSQEQLAKSRASTEALERGMSQEERQHSTNLFTLFERSIRYLRMQRATTEVGEPGPVESPDAASLAELAYRAASVDRRDAALATRLDELAHEAAALGRREEALTAGREAVELWRALAAGLSDDYASALAAALNDLSIFLAAAGERDEALTASVEAAERWRALAAAAPEAWNADLARAMTNLGNRLSELGRHDNALAAAREAVERWRALATEAAESATSWEMAVSLATALDNLGLFLSAAGERDEALAASVEAVERWRSLSATVANEICRPGIARALANHAIALQQAGRPEQALAPAREAVEVNRELAALVPDAFCHHLARSRALLASLYAQTGEAEGAAAEWTAALADLRHQFLAEPAAFGVLMRHLLRGYMNHCRAAGIVLATELDLSPLIEALERIGLSPLEPDDIAF